MFRNYLVTAFRDFFRHKLYSFINLAGLTVGLACVIFVLLFVRDELSYDRWIPGTENLYRVEKIAYLKGRDPLNIAIPPFVLPAAMQNGIPEVTAISRLYYTTMTMFAGDRPFREHVASVDPNFFRVIRMKLVAGDPALAFKDPESAVISESAARRYFGTVNAIGRIMRTTANCDNASDMAACRSRLVSLRVTGILRDIPHNSQLDGDVFLANTSVTDRLGQAGKQSWLGNCCYDYVVLAPGARPEAVVAQTALLLDRLVPTSPADPRKGSQRYAIHLTPFADVHLTSGRWSPNETPAGSIATLYGVGLVGILILFLASFNFTNLATARALLRAREIALRKSHGARRAQLVVQFLGEAVLMALLALFLALALVEMLQPAFSRLIQHPAGLHYASDWPLVLAIVAIAVVAGLIGGAYPALLLSGFRPIRALRADSGGRAGSGRLRAALVVLQFAVSIGLGIAATIVFSQVNFVRNADLGFRRDNIVVVVGNGSLAMAGQESFIQKLRTDPAILDVAMIDWPPLNASAALGAGRLAGQAGDVPLYRRVLGPNAPSLLGLKLLAGRLLSDRRALDQVDVVNRLPAGKVSGGQSVLINAAAAARLGVTPVQAVGQTLLWGANRLQIAGVLSDAKFDGAREQVQASIYLYDPMFPAYALIRIRPDATPRTLAFIDQAWHDFAPTKAVWRYFLDDNFGRLYQADERQGELLGIFVAIAIFIACLGQFGLAAFTVGRRTREIGLRKVFGARVFQIVWLLLTQFSIPVLLANLIAWPLAWYYLDHWLQGFASRITLNPLYFAGVGLAALLVAWFTILGHALHVARANPIHALRYE